MNFIRTITRQVSSFPLPGEPGSQFTIFTVADDEFITTALTMTANRSSNLGNISCETGNARLGEEEVQQISTEVFGE